MTPECTKNQECVREKKTPPSTIEPQKTASLIPTSEYKGVERGGEGNIREYYSKREDVVLHVR